ncbi:MAG TPA: xanthine dehydrogenase family protein molybdopterin-binding subunit [Stellaceae bacterium]|jgi:carbon-monoxide dehydrogenase large subunit|nr:xanthine dehydrogenase family protein molybdopterin-binding subunit [Stellaceae bacterium]
MDGDIEFGQDDFGDERYAVGQPVPRTEDPVLLRGQGRYSDDVNLPGQAYAVMVRSAYAHGVLRGIDTTEARTMPGVLAIYTAADLTAAGIGPLQARQVLKNRDGTPMLTPVRQVLATDKVRYVGHPIAAVIADSVAAAKDAAEAVLVDVEPLPAVTEPALADAPDAPQLYEDVPANVGLDFHFGDTEKVSAAFSAAAHVTRLDLRSNRIVVNPMEPRSAVAQYDRERQHFTLNVGCQGVFGFRNYIASTLGVERSQVRILTDRVGGSFGMKQADMAEYYCILQAARELGRPVKWTDERSGSFVSDTHGRDHEMTAELALDAAGNFLAIRVSGHGNLGAVYGSPGPATGNVVRNTLGVYKTPLIEVNTKCVFSNTTPVGAYRGAGRPEANYYMERLVDTAAAEMGIDKIELRRRNHIPREAMPYKAANNQTYDSGDFTALLDKALKLADWDGYAARKAQSQATGKLRGRGIGDYLELTGAAGKEMGGLRFEPNGDVTIITGTLDYGQGHAAPFAQVLAMKLGIPFRRIRLLQGDSDELIAGGGTGGSKSMITSGAAIVEASDKCIANGKQIAAHVLEAAVADIEFHGGRFVIAGTDRSVGLLELAGQLHAGLKLPPDVPQSLDVRDIIDGPPSAFPNGCHISEVEVDPETGVVEVVKYSFVNDFGVVINPLLVDGQAHGGIVQGIGQALCERTIYDDDGQLLTGSFMDYAMPRATDAPSFVNASHPVPAKTNPLGAKGCGEAGCAGALPSVMNALVDALSEYGIRHIDMPATPERVWHAIRAARSN